MLQKFRPGGGYPPDRGVALSGSRNGFSNTKNLTTLQRRRWYPTKSSRDYDWKARFSAWQSVGKIAVEQVLPKVREAKERDAKTRAELGLMPITNDGGGS